MISWLGSSRTRVSVALVLLALASGSTMWLAGVDSQKLSSFMLDLHLAIGQPEAQRGRGYIDDGGRNRRKLEEFGPSSLRLDQRFQSMRGRKSLSGSSSECGVAGATAVSGCEP